jgi:hypothetical protein
MHELELTRAPGERRLYSLGGVGTLRLEGWAARAATAEASGRSWRIARRGFLGRTVVASDGSGGIAGEFRPERLRRGGALTWNGNEFALRPASRWRERYALVEDDRDLAVYDSRGWGRRAVTVRVGDLAAVDPGLLLFGAFVVRGLAEESTAAAGSVGAAAGAAASVG